MPIFLATLYINYFVYDGIILQNWRRTKKSWINEPLYSATVAITPSIISIFHSLSPFCLSSSPFSESPHSVTSRIRTVTKRTDRSVTARRIGAANYFGGIGTQFITVGTEAYAKVFIGGGQHGAHSKITACLMLPNIVINFCWVITVFNVLASWSLNTGKSYQIAFCLWLR